MASDPQALMSEGHCFACYGASVFEILKLALLARISKASNPANDTTPQGLLTQAKCLACYGVVSIPRLMALVLLGQIAPASAPPTITPPVLSFVFPNLIWTFSGTNPEHWSIQESEDVGVTWFEVSVSAGLNRSAPFLDNGVLARIVGQDAGNNQTVPSSNVVDVE